MTDTDRDTLAPTLVRDRLAFYGYTPEQTEAAMHLIDHEAAGCFYENWNWVCTDEEDHPRHPEADEAHSTAEFVMWVLEHPAMAPQLRHLCAAPTPASTDG